MIEENDVFNQLLEQNRAWADWAENESPGWHEQISRGQQPPVFWITCSDSRVSPEIICNCRQGELFVQRNIANQVLQFDSGIQASIAFAVASLEVREIVICGHTGCGGVAAAASDTRMPELNAWLDRLHLLWLEHRAALSKNVSEEEVLDRFSAINVLAQMRNTSQHPAVQKVWRQKGRLTIRGAMFHLAEGKVNPLPCTLDQAGDGERKLREQIERLLVL